MAREKQRFFGLDFVRAMAILFVVFHHLLPISPVPGWLVCLGSLGSLGVELLFVLSGFLLAQTLLKLIDQNRFSTRHDVMGLFTKRWLRILPAYYFFFFFTAALFQPFTKLVTANFQYLFFMQNFAWKMHSFYFQTWTLAILEFFYVFFTLSVFLCWKLSNRKLLSFAICLGVFFLVPAILRINCTTLMNTSDFEATIRRWVIYRLDAPAVGVLMAVLLKEFPLIWTWLRVRWWIGLSLFTATAIYHVSGCPLLSSNHWFEVFFYPVVCFSFALMLPLILTWEENTSAFGECISFISRISYSIYVSHVIAILIILNFLIQLTHLDLGNSMIVYPVSFVFVIAVAWLSYRFIELPCVKSAEPRARSVFIPLYTFSGLTARRLATSFATSAAGFATSLGLL